MPVLPQEGLVERRAFGSAGLDKKQSRLAERKKGLDAGF
jgi:hypothetical protein